MKRILINTPCSNDGIAFFRMWDPLLKLQMDGEVQLQTFPQTTETAQLWNHYRCHIAFMNRPVLKQLSMYFVEQCKKMSVPIWLDWDDNLFQMREDNKNYRDFMHPDVQKFMDMVLRNVDIVSVTSQMEGERLKKEHGVKEYVVIPNALDDRLIRFKQPYTIPKEEGKFSWRGAPSHDWDLRDFEDELIAIADKRKSWKFNYFGMTPAWIIQKSKSKNISWSEVLNIFDYYLNLVSFNANIHLIPLQNTYFNHVKSWLSWLDGTLAGSVCVCPAWEEWNLPGMIQYRTHSEFLDRALELTEQHELNKKRNELSWEYIKDNLLLSCVNKKRLELIKNLG